jgi:hypothetical protein
VGASSTDFEGRAPEVEILIAGGPGEVALEVEAIVREVARAVPAASVRAASGFEALEALLERDPAVAVILPEIDGLSGGLSRIRRSSWFRPASMRGMRAPRWAAARSSSRDFRSGPPRS